MILMFLRISSNSCLLNLLLVRSHQAEIIIVKRLIQGRNNVTRVRIEPRPFDQGRRKTTPLSIYPCCYLASSITSHCKILKFKSMSNTRLVSNTEPEIRSGKGLCVGGLGAEPPALEIFCFFAKMT